MRDEFDSGPLFSRIGEIIVEGLGPLENRILLYADVEEGSIGVTIAEDRGNYTFFHGLPDDDGIALSDALVELWRVRKEGERWREMSYLIADGKFHAELIYPDLIDPNEHEDDRILRVVEETFGAKPAQCDPLPDTPGGYSFTL